jgi:hypothetical protein
LTEPKTTGAPALPEFVDLNTAPYLYFDMAPTYGVMAGIVQIELAARTLNPMPDGSIEVKYVAVAACDAALLPLDTCVTPSMRH